VWIYTGDLIMNNVVTSFILFVFTWGVLFMSIAAWITHVITCIQNELWVFLIAGTLAAPAGVIHGVGIWFGAWQ
jgi:hypothetical protein